jgi:histidinol phosphatase-like PHP family hydrolase
MASGLSWRRGRPSLEESRRDQIRRAEAKLKLDLHTHLFEATRFSDVGERMVGLIIAKIKEMGLDGIAVTEHHNPDYGYKVMEMVERAFENEVMIIPGREIYQWPVEIVELFLPNKATFRFIAHPGYPGDFTAVEAVHGIEVENALHNWHMDKRKVRDMAAKHNLLLLGNSDAHEIRDIGGHYTEISMKELCDRAQPKTG